MQRLLLGLALRLELPRDLGIARVLQALSAWRSASLPRREIGIVVDLLKVVALADPLH